MKNFILPAILLSALSCFPQYGDTTTWYMDKDVQVIHHNKKFGIIKNGKEIIPVKYEIEDYYGAINWDGQAYFYDSTYFTLKYEGKWGVINNRGTIIYPFEYDYIKAEKSNEHGGFNQVALFKNGQCELKDANNKTLFLKPYTAYFGKFNQRLAFQKDNRIVFWDTEKKKEFSKDTILYDWEPESKIVFYNFKFGAVSYTGEIIIPIEYDQVQSATSMAYLNRSMPVMVTNNNKSGIYEYGKGIVIPLEYNYIRLNYANEKPYYIVHKEKGKVALFNNIGKQLSGFDYSEIDIWENVIKAVKDGKEVVLDENGKEK